jgi:signal peptidase I, bacterial type
MGWRAIVYEIGATAIVTATLLLVFYGIFTYNVVSGSSMEPLLRADDYVLGVHIFGLEPQRGEIVTLIAPDSGREVIKRVIGLPGETVAYDGQYFTVNGIRLDEAYSASIGASQVGEWVVPAGSYFVAGDNRLVSNDSRAYGPVPRAAIRSIELSVVYPFNQFKFLLASN